MIAAAYLRVSTVAQADEDRWGYHRQVEDIRQYADRNGFTLAGEYRDAITGKSITRSGLTKLLGEGHQYGAVVVSSIDRLARDVGAGYRVAETLSEAGLEVHSADMGIVDFQDEASTIQFGLFSTLSHAERLRIKKRTESALLALADAGKLPNGIRTFGYEPDGKHGARIAPEQAKVVRRIFHQRLQGHSVNRIAEDLNREGVPIARPHRARDGRGAWYTGPVRHIIVNRAYKGEYVWSRKGFGAYMIPIPPIVAEDVWRRAQPRGRGAYPSNDWPLLGHLRCGVCGHRMHSKKEHKRGKRYEYYRCQSEGLPGGSCGAPYIPRAWLEDVVATEVRRSFTSYAYVRDLLARAQRYAPPEEARAQALRDELDRIRMAYRRGVFTLDEFASAKEEVEGQIEALEAPSAEGVDVGALVQGARSLPIREFLRAARIIVIATKERVRFEFSPD